MAEECGKRGGREKIQRRDGKQKGEQEKHWGRERTTHAAAYVNQTGMPWTELGAYTKGVSD